MTISSDQKANSDGISQKIFANRKNKIRLNDKKNA